MDPVSNIQDSANSEIDDGEDVDEQKSKKQKSQWTYHHVVVFFLTFISYSLIHATRKTVSNVKYSLMSAWTPQNLSQPEIFEDKLWNSHTLFTNQHDADVFMGVLDAIFMFSYAIGLFFSGILGDRIDPRLVLSVGMWGTAIVNIIFGTVIEWTHFYSIPFYIFLWILNGFLQSSGWPAEVSIMGNWFGKGSRGLVLGLWSSCASVGNIIGTYFGSLVLPYGYEYTFLVNSTLLFAFGFVVFFGLVSNPREIGLPEPVENDDPSNLKLLPKESSENRPKAIGFIQAVLLPGVIAYSLAYAFLKLVNYSIFFWLPYYMTNALHWPEAVADQVSTWYDWGGILGGIIGGVISDWMGKRSPIVVAQLVLSIGALFAYIKTPGTSTLLNGFVMGLAGFFGNGAANLISAAVSADLGRQEAVRGNSAALSTVTGIVDGTGSVGAALGQVIIPILYQVISWNAVFYMFIVMTFLTIVCLAKLCYQESKELYYNFKNRSYKQLPVDEQEEHLSS